MSVAVLISTLESALDKHSAHPALASTYNPAVLARASSLASDISFLLDVPESSWQAHPVHQALQESPPHQLTDYVSRIQYISDSAPDPSPLLAHAYVRYLGDLSGGQVIRRRIEKAYGIERDDGRGTRFYDFKQLGGNKSSNIGDMRKIKEWFRDGMNQGGGDDEERKSQYRKFYFRLFCTNFTPGWYHSLGSIVEEAIKVFELNEGLFTTLRPPSKASTAETAAQRPPLGNPSLQITPEREPSPESVQRNTATAQTEKLYSLSSVITFVLAVGLAHFVLVLGGFTGQKGYFKYDAFFNWIDGILNPAKH